MPIRCCSSDGSAWPAPRSPMRCSSTGCAGRPPVAGTLSLAEPLLAALLGVIVLQEQLTGTALAGCALMIIGLVAVTVIDARRGRLRNRTPGRRSRTRTLDTPVHDQR